MGSVRWRKVLRDFTAYRVRTVAVTASVAVGVFAVGTIAGAYALLSTGLEGAYAQGSPSAATFYTGSGFDPELVEAVERMPGVADAQARRTVAAWLERNPGDEPGRGATEIQLIALPDFDDQRIDRVLSRSGEFPPDRGEIVFERSALRLVDVERGRTSCSARRPATSDGCVSPGSPTSPVHRPRTTSAASVPTSHRRRSSTSAGPPRSTSCGSARPREVTGRAGVQAIADDVRQRLERAGTPVTFAVVAEPGRHPAQEIIGAVFLLLGSIGFLSLFVAGFLIVNTINVLMTQHLRQIGIMKVLGGRFAQILGLYLVLVALYALVALCLAVPLAALGSLGARHARRKPPQRRPRPDGRPARGRRARGRRRALPCRSSRRSSRSGAASGSRSTRALTDTGLDERFGRGAMDRLLARVRGMSRPLLLSIRSTFRRKGRLALTLAALTLGGAVFMTVFTVRGSLFATFADTARYFDYDVQVQLSEPARSATVVAEALGSPARRRRAVAVRQRHPAAAGRDRRARRWSCSACPPTPTPSSRSSRRAAGCSRARGTRSSPPRTSGGTTRTSRSATCSTLRIGGRDTTWTLVGIVQSPTFAPFLYVDAEALGRVTGGRTGPGWSWSRPSATMAPSQAQAALALREPLESVGIGVAAMTTTSDVMTTLYAAFDMLVIVVSAMAVLPGIVGGLGLTGTMTMNVVERSREIGIIRAIGATDGAVRRIFVGEGRVIGVLAWLVGAILSVPLSTLLSDVLGQVFVQRPLAFTPSLAGLGTWLAVVIAPLRARQPRPRLAGVADRRPGGPRV